MNRHTGFDWAAMMRAGISGLGLPPGEFWRLSPSELLLMLGETGPAPMHRSAFEALAARFPDLRETSFKGDQP
ncbi:MAG: phage conserved hypothetical protein [Rhodobacteraceae bacterium HLUCCO18]|nr:MAG: phage conserved hypothetical protein [Rhodobacteraceae bacterium HLUCCO18]